MDFAKIAFDKLVAEKYPGTVKEEIKEVTESVEPAKETMVEKVKRIVKKSKLASKK